MNGTTVKNKMLGETWSCVGPQIYILKNSSKVKINTQTPIFSHLWGSGLAIQSDCPLTTLKSTYSRGTKDIIVFWKFPDLIRGKWARFLLLSHDYFKLGLKITESKGVKKFPDICLLIILSTFRLANFAIIKQD